MSEATGIDASIDADPASTDLPSDAFDTVDLSIAARAQRTRWARHGAILAVLLVGVVFLTNDSSILSADEGVMLLQGTTVSDTGQWGMSGVDDIDIDREWFGMESAMRGDTQWFLVAKTPLYPMMVGWLFDLGGLRLVVLAHAAALWLTAWCCARVAENLRPGLGIPMLWGVGVASPLFFDGFWVIAHAFGTLGMALAALGLWRWLEKRRPDGLALVTVGVLLALLFRSEGVLAGLALAAAMVAVEPRRWIRAAPVAVISGALSVLVYKAGPAVQTRLLDGEQAYAFAPTYGESSLLGSRVSAFQTTVVSGGRGLAGGLAAVAVLLLVGCFVAWRLNARENVVRNLGAAAIAVGVLRFLVAPDLISGLAIACPAMFLGWALLGRRHLASAFVRVCGLTALLGFAAIEMTQYRYGGVAEWGGRYFHLMLPFAFIVAGLAVWDRRSVDRSESFRYVLVAATVLSLVWAGSAVRAHVSLRSGSEALNEDVWAAAEQTQGARQPDGPVIVSTWSPAGRFMWDRIPESRFLTVTDADDYPLLGRRMIDAGVPDAVVIVQPDMGDVLERLGPEWTIGESVPINDGEWRAVTVERTTT